MYNFKAGDRVVYEYKEFFYRITLLAPRKVDGKLFWKTDLEDCGWYPEEFMIPESVYDSSLYNVMK